MTGMLNGHQRHDVFKGAAQQVALTETIMLRKLEGVNDGNRVALVEKLLHGVADVTRSDTNAEMLVVTCRDEEQYRLANKMIGEFLAEFESVKQKVDGKKKRTEEMYIRVGALRAKHGLKDRPNKVPGFLRDVRPLIRTALSEGQVPYIDALADDDTRIVAALGHFGSGKTYLPTAQALEDIVLGRRSKLIATRKDSPVHKQIGFVPGTQHDKTKRDNHAIFEQMVKVFMDWGVPEKDALDKVERLVKPDKGLLPGQEIVEIVLPAQLEGRTIHDAIIILDEAHGIPTSVMRGILGRLGENCKLVIIGDFHQINDKRLRNTHYDEDDGCGLAYAISLLADSPNMDNLSVIVSMDAQDVHRSDATREVASAMQAYAKKRGLFPTWQADIDRSLELYRKRRTRQPRAPRIGPHQRRAAQPARDVN